jgi:hypothetical protein
MGDSPAKRLTLITRVAGARWAKGAKRILPIVPALGEVANFGTDYFLSKIKFLAKCKREFTTKFAILPNACCV